MTVLLLLQGVAVCCEVWTELSRWRVCHLNSREKDGQNAGCSDASDGSRETGMPPEGGGGGGGGVMQQGGLASRETGAASGGVRE